MREITGTEQFTISAGVESHCQHSYYDEFWISYYQAAGWGAGYISAIPITIGMLTYSIWYYGVYAPIYYVFDSVNTSIKAALGLI